jgi:hypothetical protein
MCSIPNVFRAEAKQKRQHIMQAQKNITSWNVTFLLRALQFNYYNFSQYMHTLYYCCYTITLTTNSYTHT